MGAKVDEVTAYETELTSDGKTALIDLLKDKAIDAVTFTSSSTVSNFMSLLEDQDSKSLLEDVALASIGPITSDTARSLGLAPDIEAEAYTIPGLIDALLAHYAAAEE
jgi:uroporphyrinogen III methyltransferase/synthase